MIANREVVSESQPREYRVEVAMLGMAINDDDIACNTKRLSKSQLSDSVSSIPCTFALEIN